MRIGDGKANWPMVLKTLVEQYNYDRYLTIEREIEGDQQIEDIRFAKAYLESILRNLE